MITTPRHFALQDTNYDHSIAKGHDEAIADKGQAFVRATWFTVSLIAQVTERSSKDERTDAGSSMFVNFLGRLFKHSSYSTGFVSSFY